LKTHLTKRLQVSNGYEAIHTFVDNSTSHYRYAASVLKIIIYNSIVP